MVRYRRDPLVLNTRGVILFRLNRLREAKQDLQRCLEMANIPPGTQARTLAFLARIAFRNEDPRESRRLFEKALEIDRKNKVLDTSERADIEKSLGITPSRPAIP